MQKKYKSGEVEDKWQEKWKEEGFYNFNPDSGKPVFSIDTPPPFTSGTLHLGHIYNHVWIDVVARYKRMRGYEVYLPQGFDCHGLPTELKVEEKLGVSKENKEEFLNKCQEWTSQAISKMKKQFDAIGYSTDWNYTYKTMDDSYKELVQSTLLDLYKEGLLYREKHPVLWCPKCETALAKAEVGYVDKEGKLYYIDLEVEGEEEDLTIATTRPEMMPSCVAVFVHPQDEEYQKFVGKEVSLPLFDRKVPVIEDEGVDREFGTGAVYLCTYGDEQDIQWQKKYSLPMIISINEKGILNEKAGKYEGMKVEKAREEIAKDLQEKGRISKVESITHSILAHTERSNCSAPIEFLPLDQWFINVMDFLEDIRGVSEDMNWHPPHMLQRLINWSESMDWDWIISRQRTFGTPIPFWICERGHVIPADESDLPLDPSGTVKKCPECGKKAHGEQAVCDCWVDSSITPLIISKWNSDEDFFQKTYPSSLRPQGYEIIRTWAFYTIFRNLILTGKACFEDLLINGMVRGEDGRKMSKSLGNVIPPEEPLEEYSVDALRQWASLGSLGGDYPFSWEECDHSQAFLTKLWNISRFLSMHLEDWEGGKGELREVDKWILSKLQKLERESTENLDNYVFNIPLEKTRSFIWHDLADDYLEMVKHRLYKPEVYGEQSKKAAQYTLQKILKDSLRLLAPFTPHICEEIWSNLFSGYATLQEWPSVEEELINEEAEHCGQLATGILSQVRKYKSDNSLSLTQELRQVKILVREEHKEKVEKVKEDIQGTGKIKQLPIESSEVENFELEFKE